MKLPPLVWRLGWISFFADVASEMAYPILPMFLRSIGAPAAALGLVEGLADATANVLKGLSGVRSDRKRKRVPYVRWGYGLSALGKPLIALASSWPMVGASRVLDRVGKGVRTSARDALLAECATKDTRGAVFGVHRTMDTAGAMAGVILALILIQFMPGQYRTIFVLAAIPGAVSLWLAMRLRESVPTEAPPVSGVHAKTVLSPALKRVIAIHAVFAIANTSDTFLLLKARESGVSEVGVIAMYLVYNLATVLLSYPAGKLSDHIGRWPLVAFGWTLYACVYWGFAHVTGGGLWGLFTAYGLYIALTQGVAKAQVADLASPNQKGTAMGMFHMVGGLCTLAGNIGFGLVWDAFGARSALIGAAFIAIVAICLIPLMRPSTDASASGS